MLISKLNTTLIFTVLQIVLRLSDTAHAACMGKKVVLTEEVEVSEEEFSELTQGGVMKIGPTSGRRKRQAVNCTVKVSRASIV